MGAATYPFEDALVFLKDGERVAREAWHEGVYLEVHNGRLLINPGDPSTGTPWEPGATDLMADDWVML